MALIIIDGVSRQVGDDTLILNAAAALGVEIPTFCSHPRLEPMASCRMCLIEVEGIGKLQPACATRVTEGMVVHTDTAKVRETRKSMLEMLLANHPLDCPTCDKGGECDLQDHAYEYGAPESRYDEDKRRFHNADLPLNSVVIANLNRCIQCNLCIRYCDEVVGAQALGAIGIGANQIATGFMDSLAGCDHCGNCIEVCPVGALMSRPFRYKARPWDLKEVDTVCPFCGTGCQISVGAREGELMRVHSKCETGLNQEALCVRGRFGIDFANSTEQRLQQPLIRQDKDLVAVSWNKAFGFIGEKLKQIRRSNKTIGGLVSPSLTNETLYGFQKLMHHVFDSNTIDSFCRWPLAEAYPVLEQLIDRFYSRKPLEELLKVDRLLIIGSNVTDENPISEYLIREAHRANRFDMTVLSPRPSRLDRMASAYQRYIPGEEPALIASILSSLANEDKQPPLRSQSIAVLVGTDLLRSPGATHSLQLLLEHLKTLQTNGRSIGLQFLFDRCNQLGAWDLGVTSQCDFNQMLSMCDQGQMGMLYVVGEDPLLSCPDPERVKRALSQLDLLIVQDAFASDTMELADVVLPGFTFAESTGTFTNNEGRVQRVRPIYPPPTKTVMNAYKAAPTIYPAPFRSQAKLDVRIFSEMALALGTDLGLSSLEQVFCEMAATVPGYAELDINDLGNQGRFSGATLNTPESSVKPTTLTNLECQLTRQSVPDTPDDNFYLITGNSMFHSGYLSEYSPTLAEIENEPYVELSELDALALGPGSADGDYVLVSNPHHQLTLKVKTNSGFARGVAFIPENFKAAQLNRFFAQGDYPCLVKIRVAQPAAVDEAVGSAEGNTQ